MVDFADSVTDKALQRMLEIALDGRGAFRRFKNVLYDFPEERKRWFEFEAGRMHERVMDWLEEHNIELIA